MVLVARRHASLLALPVEVTRVAICTMLIFSSLGWMQDSHVHCSLQECKCIGHSPSGPYQKWKAFWHVGCWQEERLAVPPHVQVPQMGAGTHVWVTKQYWGMSKLPKNPGQTCLWLSSDLPLPLGPVSSHLLPMQESKEGRHTPASLKEGGICSQRLPVPEPQVSSCVQLEQGNQIPHRMQFHMGDCHMWWLLTGGLKLWGLFHVVTPSSGFSTAGCSLGGCALWGQHEIYTGVTSLSSPLTISSGYLCRIIIIFF